MEISSARDEFVRRLGERPGRCPSCGQHVQNLSVRVQSPHLEGSVPTQLQTLRGDSVIANVSGPVAIAVSAVGGGKPFGFERQYLHLQVRDLPTPSCDAGYTAVFLSSQSSERERFALLPRAPTSRTSQASKSCSSAVSEWCMNCNEAPAEIRRCGSNRI